MPGPFCKKVRGKNMQRNSGAHPVRAFQNGWGLIRGTAPQSLLFPPGGPQENRAQDYRHDPR